MLIAPHAFSYIWFYKGAYVLTLSSPRNIIICMNFFHLCFPKDIYFVTVTHYCNSFQFNNTKSSSYSFFLLSACFLLKARPTILLFSLFFSNFLAKFCIFYTYVYCRDNESNFYHVSEKSEYKLKFPRRRCKSVASFLAFSAQKIITRTRVRTVL